MRIKEDKAVEAPGFPDAEEALGPIPSASAHFPNQPGAESATTVSLSASPAFVHSIPSLKLLLNHPFIQQCLLSISYGLWAFGTHQVNQTGRSLCPQGADILSGGADNKDD